jgi:hypothetical protein
VKTSDSSPRSHAAGHGVSVHAYRLARRLHVGSAANRNCHKWIGREVLSLMKLNEVSCVYIHFQNGDT